MATTTIVGGINVTVTPRVLSYDYRFFNGVSYIQAVNTRFLWSFPIGKKALYISAYVCSICRQAEALCAPIAA